MNVPKGFKQTEVGVIPQDWSVISAADACQKIQDGTHFSPKINGNNYLYVTSKNIRNGFLDFSTAGRIDKNQHDLIYKRCDVKKGDILFTKDGANTGNAAINTLQEEFSLLSSVAFLRVKEIYDTRYFLQQILSSEGQKQIQEAMSGNAITRLTLEKINKLVFPLPPTRAEQTAIAAALSDMDALIEGVEKLLEKKRRIKQGAMQELLRPKEGWIKRTLGEALKIKHGRSQKDVCSLQGIYPILASGGIIGRAAEFLYNKPSVLIGRKGKIDDPQYMDTPFWAVDTLFYSEILNGYNAKFIFYIFKLIDWYAYNEASGVPSLNAKTIENIEIYFPELEEQEEIAAILSDMDSEIEQLETQLTKYRQLKTGMMQERWPLSFQTAS